MERKQGFFAALKEEVVRGLSPARSRGRSKSPSPAALVQAEEDGEYVGRRRSVSPVAGLLLPRRRKHRRSHSMVMEPQLVARSGSFRPAGEVLTPLMEGPEAEAAAGEAAAEGRREGWGQWVRGQLSRAPSVSAAHYYAASGGSGGGSSSTAAGRRSDLRLMLGVMGAPLAPIRVSTLDPLPHLSIKDTPIVSNLKSLLLPFLLHYCLYGSKIKRHRKPGTL